MARGAPNESRALWAAATQMDPERQQRLARTDTDTQREALYVRSLSHVTRAAENFSEIIH